MRKHLIQLDHVTEKLLIKLSPLSTFYIVTICVIINLVIAILCSTFLFPGISNGIKFSSITEEFVLVILVAPLIETWVVQGFVLQQCLRLSGNNKFVAILLSSIIFSLLHIYPHPQLVFFTFFSGVLFAVIFFATESKWRNPLILVFIAHAVYNLIVSCLNHLS